MRTPLAVSTILVAVTNEYILADRAVVAVSAKSFQVLIASEREESTKKERVYPEQRKNRHTARDQFFP